MSNIALRISKQIFFDGPAELGLSIYQKGPVDIFNDLSKDEGVEKVHKIILWLFPLLGDDFKPATLAVRQTLGVLYGTMIVKGLNDIIVDMQKKPHERKLMNRYAAASTILLTIGSFCKFIRFITRELKLVDIPILGMISNEMGKYKIFHFPILISVRMNIGDFFILLGTGGMSIGRIVQLCMEHKTFKRKNPNYDFVKEMFAPKELLKHIGNIGKIVLITFGPFHASQPWYIVAVGVTNVASLIAACMPKDRLPRYNQKV